MKTGLAKIEGEPGLLRDLGTGAVISTDMVALSAYKTRKQREAKMEEAFQEMETIRCDLCNIKTLLEQLVNKE